MPTFGPDDFWAAIRRLYDQQLKHDEQLAAVGKRIAEITEIAAGNDERIAEVGELVAKHDAELAKLSDELREIGGYVRETSEQVRLTTEQLQHTDARLDQLVGLVRSHEDRLHGLENRAS
jgi:chromosome segregation ATPase